MNLSFKNALGDCLKYGCILELPEELLKTHQVCGPCLPHHIDSFNSPDSSIVFENSEFYKQPVSLSSHNT